MRRILLLLAVLFSFIPGSARAHLALITMGPESTGQAQPGYRFGAAVAAGDFDGDGFDDLATAAPHSDEFGIDDGQENGRVSINVGTKYGLTHVGAYYRNLPTADADDHYGWSLATGNFNGDAYEDLAVGAPGFDANAVSNSGAVFVYYGSASGLDTSAVMFIQEDCGETSEANDQFGWALASGDFDDNGYDDLGVGGIGEDGERGAVYHIRSNASGLNPPIVGSGTFKQSVLGDTESPGEWFGYSLAAGHLIGDAADDLAVGCPYDNDLASGGTIAGKVFVIEGDDPFGLSSSGGTAFNGQDLGIGIAPDGRFGWSLAIGRLAHQATLGGVLDLAIGEPGFPADGQDNAGRVVVTLATQADSPIVVDQDDILGTSETVEPDDQFGWALATGRPTGGTFDDLAVGTPREARAISDAGAVAIFRGSCCNFPGPGGEALDGDLLWSYNGQLELGYALAYGQFDSTANENLAIGSPSAFRDVWVDYDLGGHLEAGQVHVYAPHRQVMQTRARGAAVFDCDDNLIFSVHPFDRLQVASTTKIWPASIAADHIAWGLADSNDVVTVDPWIAFCFNGSEAGLQANEEVRLIDLMRMAISVSGGDACHAIGDGLTGQTWNYPPGDDCDAPQQIPEQTPAFADSMNQRAIALGMDHTFVVDPAGRPYSKAGLEPKSTAYDMALLARRAMQNPLYRDIVGTEEWTINRDMMFGNIPVNVDDTFPNNWLQTMRGFFPSSNPLVTGAKPGSNNPSKQTRVLTAIGDVLNQKEVIVTLMGVRLAGGSDGGWADSKSAQLCSLAVSACGIPVVDFIPIPADTGAIAEIPGVPTSPPDSAHGAIPQVDEKDEDLLIEVYRQDVATPTTSFELCFSKSVDWVLDPGETRGIRVMPKDSTAGVVVRSLGYSPMSLQIEHNLPTGTSYSLALAGGEDSLVVPPSNIPGTELELMVTNLSSTEPETLQVDERGYCFDVTLGDGATGPSGFSALVHTDSPGTYRRIVARVRGSGEPPGNTVRLLVRRPGTVIGVADEGERGPSGPGVLRFARAFPNPSRSDAFIEYSLAKHSPILIEVFDLSGRLIRRVEKVEAQTPGVHRIRWDLRGENGVQVRPGVYFCRVKAGAESRENRFVVLH